jgi:mono/diheme cytochrome c family protein
VLPYRFHLLNFLFLSMVFQAIAQENKPSTSAFVPVMPNRDLYEQGRYVYEQNCMICRGRYGDGKGELSATLVPKPRPFASGVFKFHTTPAGFLPTNEDLKRTIRDGLAGTAMGMFTRLSDGELNAVIEYVKSFSRKWRKVENYAPQLPTPSLPTWFAKDEEMKKHSIKGSEIFSAACITCHGPNGDGKGILTPTLKDMWDEPAVPADLRESWLRRGTDLREVYLALLTGRDGTPMVSFAQSLTEEQRWDLVAYVDSLRKKKASEK